MIWIWIVAAVLISWRLCRKKAAWYHYIWMLLPIDMYGVSFAGATIKPYMIFGAFIVFYNIKYGKSRNVPIGIIAFVLALIISDILTGFILASVKIHILMVIVVAIAYSYCLMCGSDSLQFDGMSEVMSATTLGYGIIFSLAYLVYRFNPSFGQVYTLNRYSSGIFLGFITANRDVVVRLRGFSIDPNIVITTLTPGAAVAFGRLSESKNGRALNAVTIIAFSLVTYLSGSRTATICAILLLMAMVFVLYKQSKHKKRFFIVCVLFIGASIVWAGFHFNELRSAIVSYFTVRARLNDEAGRITIWKNNLEWLWDNNKLLTGVGQKQISYLNGSGKEFHNTWLEWIGGTGLFIGIGIDLWFLLAPIAMKNKMKHHQIEKKQYVQLMVAYMVIIICVTTVNEIANSAMIILMILFRYGKVASVNVRKLPGLDGFQY